MDSLIHKLERGKECCNQMINIFHKLQPSSLLSLDYCHHYKKFYYDYHANNNNNNNNISYLLNELDGHCKVVQTTLDDALFVLRSYDFIEDIIIHMNNNNKTNVRRTDHINDSSKHYCNFIIEDNKFGGEIPKHVTSFKDTRGCHKRRRNEHEKIIEAWNLSDDGYAWRKYGQKVILNATYPRNYYRCTHKYEEGCKASKQVQQISENPPKYKMTYHGEHTCKAGTSSKSNPTTILIESNDDDDNQKNSINVLSSETGKHALNNPFMFPPPPTTPSSSSSLSIKEEVITVSDEPSSNDALNSPDDHQCVDASSPVVTAVSHNLLADLSNVDGMDADECYSNILGDDLINLDDIYNQPNPFTLTKLMTTF